VRRGTWFNRFDSEFSEPVEQEIAGRLGRQQTFRILMQLVQSFIYYNAHARNQRTGP